MRKHRSLPYILTAGALILAVVIFVVGRSGLAGGAALAAGDRTDANLPLGGGPDKKEAETPAAGENGPYENEAWFSDPDGLLTVVDRETSLARAYAPADLVSLTDHGVPAQPAAWTARRIILDDLKELFAAGKEAGFDYFVFSAYRSYDRQAELFQYWVKTLGEKEADRSSARAGHSEHQLGTALDISVRGLKGDVFAVFGETPAGRWLAANAGRFGFGMSYPDGGEAATGYEYEPWHFRYVGRSVAALIKEQGAVPPVFIRELERRRRNKASRRP